MDIKVRQFKRAEDTIALGTSLSVGSCRFVFAFSG
jgi:hypothetical protein